mgnify:CR=1 FL=1
MDADDISQIIFLLILLALSAFFSSSETALTTVNKIRMRTLAEAGNTKAKKVLKVTENSPKMLSAILIGNIVNLSASSLTTSLAIKLFGSVGAGVATGILTFLILIFGEVSPKTLATIKADKISLSIAGFISVLMVGLTPEIFFTRSHFPLWNKTKRCQARHDRGGASYNR